MVPAGRPLGLRLPGRPWGPRHEFTSERLCWRPPHWPSASRSEQPVAPPSCSPWPLEAGCPGSRTSSGPRRSHRRRCTTTKTKQQREERTEEKVLEEEEEKEGLYEMTADSTIWSVVCGVKISESGSTHKRGGEEEKMEGRGGRKRTEKQSVQDVVTPQCRSAAQLFIGFCSISLCK